MICDMTGLPQSEAAHYLFASEYTPKRDDYHAEMALREYIANFGPGSKDEMEIAEAVLDEVSLNSADELLSVTERIEKRV